MSEPRQEFLAFATLTNGLPHKTRLEMAAGKLFLLKQAEVDNAVTFVLEEFIRINDRLQEAMAAWGLKRVEVGAIREGDHITVKAITPEGSVVFEEPIEDFPSEELMTKLTLIDPQGRE